MTEVLLQIGEIEYLWEVGLYWRLYWRRHASAIESLSKRNAYEPECWS